MRLLRRWLARSDRLLEKAGRKIYIYIYIKDREKTQGKKETGKEEKRERERERGKELWWMGHMGHAQHLMRLDIC